MEIEAGPGAPGGDRQGAEAVATRACGPGVMQMSYILNYGATAGVTFVKIH